MAVLATLRRSGDKKEEREETKALTSDIYKEMYKFIWESETPGNTLTVDPSSS